MCSWTSDVWCNFMLRYTVVRVPKLPVVKVEDDTDPSFRQIHLTSKGILILQRDRRQFRHNSRRYLVDKLTNDFCATPAELLSNWATHRNITKPRETSWNITKPHETSWRNMHMSSYTFLSWDATDFEIQSYHQPIKQQLHLSNIGQIQTCAELVMKMYEIFVKNHLSETSTGYIMIYYNVERIVAIAACFLGLTAVLSADRWGVLLPYHGMSGFTFGKWCRFMLLRPQSRQAFNAIYINILYLAL